MKKILVIDDDVEQRELYAELFRENHFEVVKAFDGLEGLEKALAEKPDLIFTGIIMPRMDGFELIRNLKNNTLTVAIPVIMFSHLGREEDRQKAHQFDVHFMIKGLDEPKRILQKVNEILTLGKSNNKKISPAEEEGPAVTQI